MKKLLLGVIVAFILTGCDSSDYEKAVEEMNAGNYEQATSIFEELGDYKDSLERVKEIEYEVQESENECEYENGIYLKDHKDYDRATATFIGLGDYKDSEQLVQECIYGSAEKAFSVNDFEKSLNQIKMLDVNNDNFEIDKEIEYISLGKAYEEGNFLSARKTAEILGDFKNTNDFIKKMDILESMQGTWKEKEVLGEKEGQYIFAGGKIAHIYYSGNNKYVSVYKVLFRNGFPYLLGKFYIDPNGDLCFESSTGEPQVYTKISSSIEIPENEIKVKKIDPYIGMPEQELLASTWGTPEKKNVTETTYGKSEQWVYPGNKYVYVENGIVVSLQY